MADSFASEQTDSYFQHLTAARDTRSVVKVDFASYVSRLPAGTVVLAYEGPTDKYAYYHWIKRLREDLTYEPYVAKSKRAVLQLFDVLMDDETGLGEGVYFFVDRDFDDLQGRESHDKIFITDTYSIENQMVCEEVVEELLKIDFHCDGYRTVRSDIVALFSKVYGEFLEVTKDLNFRIYVARKCDIRLDNMPAKIAKLAIVDVDSIARSEVVLEEAMKLDREPTQEELDGCMTSFSALDPRAHHRGKFALLFFLKWLTKLRDDRTSDAPTHFKDIPLPHFGIKGEISFEMLATKSPPPTGLSAFLDRILAAA